MMQAQEDDALLPGEEVGHLHDRLKGQCVPNEVVSIIKAWLLSPVFI